MHWTPARDREKYGVAIYNYYGDNDSCIKLNVGDTVHILEELGDWYFGLALHNKAVRGVFPKPFIQVRECIVDKTGPVEVVSARLPPIVHEVTAVLREWGVLLRKLYVEEGSAGYRRRDLGEPKFQRVRDTMLELVSCRRKILSGTLPGDELKQLKQRITVKIDSINVLLGLDLVVRDDAGNILNPDISSAVKLFRHHHEAENNIKMYKGEVAGCGSSVKRKPHICWTAYVNINNIIIRVPESSEISVGLFCGDPRDGTERPLSENFNVKWTENGYNSNQDLLFKTKCLYTDLSTVSLEEKRVWLLGSIVREGSMINKETDSKRITQGFKKPPISDAMRRPFGMVVLDITDEIKKLKASPLNQLGCFATQESEYFAPLYLCGDKETLDPKKLLQYSRTETGRDKMGIRFTLQLVNGDLKQLRDENPHFLSLREVPVAMRLGLSDVIMPGDVRNDLYISLMNGEFSRENKIKDKNVEVNVTVIDERGSPIPGVISQGCGKESLDQYRSVTYHHEGKPKWMETFKIALPIDEFKKAHVRFTFKHRSTNDVKDKNEKPFALSFVKLMQENGTTLMNVDHNLVVYKITQKNWSETDVSYLNMPWRRVPGEELDKGNKQVYYPSARDNFVIATTFCSTKLTQNADLLSLLEWGWSGSTDKQVMRNCLDRLAQVPPEELMIFLQDTLDVLLEILMNNTEDDDGDNRIFEALINVITTAMDKNKVEAFQPVLDSYIQQNFHATLVYNKLIHVMKYFVEHSMDPKCQKTLMRSMKCLQYIFKFIIRSRQLFVDLYGRGREEFEKSLHQLLEAMAKMMEHTTDSTLTIQAHCLKYITATIADTITNFDPMAMSFILVNMLDNLDPKRIPKQKLTTLNEIIHSELFRIRECRQILLPSFVVHIKNLLAANEEVTDMAMVKQRKKREDKLKDMLGDQAIHDMQQANADDKNKLEELELCVKILGDILDVLFSADVGPTYEDISLLTNEMLQNILSIVSKMDRAEKDILRKFVSVLVSLMRQMTEQHFSAFLNQYKEQDELMAFLVELLLVIQDLIEHPVFPSDWAEMVLLQNSVMVKVLRHSSHVISEKMRDPFKEVIWSNFFHCAIKFVTQPSLQLEQFTQSKRNKILNRYKDMRKETALEIKKLWFSLGQYKIRFIATTGGPSMVGPFLEMTMLPDYDLRKATIPIFFDMMQCEFYSCKDRSNQTPPEMGGPKDGRIRGKFDEFEREMLEKLDHLVEGGRGDEHYREVFQKIVGALCEDHTTMRESGLQLVSTVTKLMDRLLQYRAIMNTPDYSPETRMSCTANLLDFYSSINRKELYLRYVYKLTKLHLSCDNYTEAGFTLLLHTKYLKWEDEMVPPALRHQNYPNMNRHDQLKQELYREIIKYFDKGKMWEDALCRCKELMVIYENEMLDYDELAKLHSRIAEFYKKIMDPHNMRPEPEYFRVAYYGRGFPAFLQNKVFVYRGNGFERLQDFTTRILDQFPNAELMKKLTQPSKEVKESPQQFLQINKVDCIMAENHKFRSPKVSNSIQSYYRVNRVKTFAYSRPFHRGQKDSGNEFATLCVEKTTLHTSYELPGILRCFPVSNTTSEVLSPLENAIESMKNACLDVTDMIKKYHRNSTLPLDPLTRTLSGRVDPAVMGGVANYEKAFVCDEYLQQHPGDGDKVRMLQDYIAQQVPLLEIGLHIHGSRLNNESLSMPLHKHMLETFQSMRTDVQEKHGVSQLPELGFDIRSMRISSQRNMNNEASPRNSQYNDSVDDDDGSVELRNSRSGFRNDSSFRHSLTRGISALSSRHS